MSTSGPPDLRTTFSHNIYIYILYIYIYIGVRGSPERDISSLHALVDGGWTCLDVSSATAFPGLAWAEYGIGNGNGMEYGI